MLYQLYLHISKTRQYKYNKPIRNTILNFNNLKLVSDLDIETSSPDSWDCKDSKFCYQPAGHIVTGNLKIITDSRIRSVISKGPKYRFPAHTDFNKCRETIASALNGYCTRWCKREHVESNALNTWKLKIFKIIDERVLFYSNNHDLLPPKPKLSFRYLKQGIQEFHTSMFWLQLIKLLIMLLSCDDFIISIPLYKNLVVPIHMNGFLLTRDLLSIPILSILLLSLQWVLKKSKTDFLRYIGYRNFINDLIKHVSLLILVHVRLLFCPNCLLHALLLLKTLD